MKTKKSKQIKRKRRTKKNYLKKGGGPRSTIIKQIAKAMIRLKTKRHKSNEIKEFKKIRRRRNGRRTGKLR
jgi:hypothetical protein